MGMKFEFWLKNKKILELNKKIPVPRIGEKVSLVGFDDLGDFVVEDVMYDVADNVNLIYLQGYIQGRSVNTVKIKHHIHFNGKYKNKILDIIWEAELPYKLVKGDDIHFELFDKGNNVFNKDNGKLKKTPAIWDDFVMKTGSEYFDVVCTWIEHTGIVNVIVDINEDDK